MNSDFLSSFLIFLFLFIVDEFMFKEGVQDQLDKLDRELVGLIPVKQRVKEIAALLVLDKMRRKLGFETAVPSLHMCFTGCLLYTSPSPRDLSTSRMPSSA